MLISFKVANFHAFRDIQELSLYRAGKAGSEVGGWPRPDVSPVAAIYGANAAGKSALVQAIRFLVHAVEASYKRWSDNGGTPRTPFLLDDAVQHQPSEFEIEFIADDGVEYQYGFSLDSDKIVSEHLYAYRTHRRSILFERNVDGRPWYFGPSFRGPANQIRDTTRANALFLSAAAAGANAVTHNAYRWLVDRLDLYIATEYQSEHPQVIERIEKDKAFSRRLGALLRHADLGVDGLEVVDAQLDPRVVLSVRNLITQMSPGIDERFLNDFEASQEKSMALRHRGRAYSTRLPFDSESDGTKALISFLSITMHALETGSTCVVDEIDSSLHPLLVSELVEVFQDSRANPKQSQLIFTTHDVSLLDRVATDSAVLNRDQVWVVKKDQAGASSLVAISEYGLPRARENLSRGYLTGRYGGIPKTSLLNEMLASSALRQVD